MVVVFDMVTGERNLDDFLLPGDDYADADDHRDRLTRRGERRGASRLELQSALPRDVCYDMDALISTVSTDSWE